jgi:hypothetical protein
MDTKITAKDFFLHISVIALLYTGVVALLNILFRAINYAYPQINSGYYYGGSSSISFPVATLIVAFPLFLILSNILRKSYESDPTRREYAVRRGLVYLTIFVAGAVLAGDLVTILYYFLDGRELTTAFILKFVSVLVVVGSVFGYYLDDLKDRLTGSRRNLWRIVAAILVVGSIVIGFSVLGTPAKQRQLRYDSQRVSDLQNIQWQVLNYYQQKGVLPSALAELQDPISGYNVPTDPQGKGYEYEKTGNLSFNLCSTFNREAASSNGYGYGPSMPIDMGMKAPDNWQHGVGHTCFNRTIDPALYPVRPLR